MNNSDIISTLINVIATFAFINIYEKKWHKQSQNTEFKSKVANLAYLSNEILSTLDKEKKENSKNPTWGNKCAELFIEIETILISFNKKDIENSSNKKIYDALKKYYKNYSPTNLNMINDIQNIRNILMDMAKK